MELHQQFLQWTSIFLILVATEVTSINAKSTSENISESVTIIAVGQSGAGISSTVRELLGLNIICIFPTNFDESLRQVVEYTVDIPVNETNNYKLKFFDIPGFDRGKSNTEDFEILASLKSILQSTGNPDFYLAVSSFNQNRFDGESSAFVKFLQKLELLFNTAYLNKNVAKAKTLFILTHLMSETRKVYRKPAEKIEHFRKVIEKYSAFTHPISIVVGENKAADYDREVIDGYFQLPNRELYPINVWKSLVAMTKEVEAINLLSSIMNSRELSLKCEVRLISTKWKYHDDDVNAFGYLVGKGNLAIETTEINGKIQTSFDKYNDSQKLEGIVQKIALQLRLQDKDVEPLNNPPMSDAARIDFFQGEKLFSAPIPAHLLEQAVGLKMSEYIHKINVGYGYAVLEDKVKETPFKSTFEPSSLGFQFPNFMKCEKLFKDQSVSFKDYVANFTEYIEERLKHLEFDGKEDINTSVNNFPYLKIKEGYNLKGENSTLSVIVEKRILSCSLKSDFSHLLLNETFINDVKDLTKIDENAMESRNMWNKWFKTWGSHLVVKSNGGGKIYGKLVKDNLINILGSEPNINIALNSIADFTKTFPKENLGGPTYLYFGGNPGALNDSNNNGYKTVENVRHDLIKQWQESLKYNFIMLDNHFRLESISNLIKVKFGKEKGNLVEEAIKLYLKGKLQYQKQKPQKESTGNNGNGNGTSNNISTTTKGANTNESDTTTDEPITYTGNPNAVTSNTVSSNTNTAKPIASATIKPITSSTVKSITNTTVKPNTIINKPNTNLTKSNSTQTNNNANKQVSFLTSEVLILFMYLVLAFVY